MLTAFFNISLITDNNKLDIDLASIMSISTANAEVSPGLDDWDWEDTEYDSDSGSYLDENGSVCNWELYWETQLCYGTGDLICIDGLMTITDDIYSCE